MITLSSSIDHLRLVKKLPGQPPSGAIVPSVARGAPEKFIPHCPRLGDVSIQRPAILIATGGAFSLDCPGGHPKSEKRSPRRSPVQPAADTIISSASARNAKWKVPIMFPSLHGRDDEFRALFDPRRPA